MSSSKDSTALKQLNTAQSTFDRLKAAYRKQPYLSYKERYEVLLKIEQILVENEQQICDRI